MAILGEIWHQTKLSPFQRKAGAADVILQQALHLFGGVGRLGSARVLPRASWNSLEDATLPGHDRSEGGTGQRQGKRRLPQAMRGRQTDETHRGNLRSPSVSPVIEFCFV